jgi:hypothetical protein
MVEQANPDPFAKSSSLPQTLGADLSNLYESVYKKTDDEAQKAKETYAKEAGEIGVQKAKLKAGPVKEYANKYAEIKNKYEPELMAKVPEFKVDQNTASGIASIATLLPIAGALFGGKGQMSGIGALQAMDGVLKGYQAGNQQRIEFEKTKFEKELQNFKMHQDQIQKAFDRAIEGAKVNLTAATARLESDLAALDAKNLKEMVKRDGIVGGQTGYHNLIDPIAKELAKNLPSVMSIGAGTTAGPYAATALTEQPPEKQAETRQWLASSKLSAGQITQLDSAKRMRDEAETVAKEIAKDPDAVGLIANMIKKATPVFGAFKDMSQLDTAVSNELASYVKDNPENRNLAQRASVISKMLQALSLKDAAATGRPTVFLERMIGGWYNQGYDPVTLIDIIRERAKESDSVLSNYKLDVARNREEVNAQKYPLLTTGTNALMKQYGAKSSTETAPAAASVAGGEAPLPMPKTQSDLVVGKLYQTPRGLARWNGTAFEAMGGQ